MKRKAICIILSFLLLIAADIGSVSAYALSEPQMTDGIKIVRVGYYSGESSFQDGFSDGERKSGYAYEYYQEIAALTNWKYEYVYGTYAEIYDMLVRGDVDIAAGLYKTPGSMDEVLFSGMDMSLEGEDRYFAVRKNAPELLGELDHAMEQLRLSSPDYPITLRQKYYSQSTTQVLTEGEREWLARKGVLKIGYVRHNLPVSDCGKDGMPTGLVRDLMSILSTYLNIDIDPVCYENITAMETALADNEIDAAFPAYSDLWLTEKKGFKQTDSFLSDRVMMVYKGNYSDDILDRVALSETGIGQRNYMDTYFPDSQVVFYESREDALDAVLRGDERCILGCSSIFQRFMSEHPKYQDLNVAYLNTSEDFGMEVNINNAILTGILNKVVRRLTPASVTALMVQYSSTDTQYTFTDVLRKYSVVVITVISSVFAALLILFISYSRKTRIFNEEQARTRAELEKAYDAAKVASEAKTTFLSSMSHDIRTPMNAIIGMTAIAMKNKDDPERLSDCLDKIDSSGQYLMTLINDILDISKIESGKLAFNPTVFSIRDTVFSLVNIVRPQIRAKDLDFEVHIHGVTREMLYADEVRVNQVFVNILTNSVKYTPEGGRITLDLYEELLCDGEFARLTYVVDDNGIGMSDEFMEYMYDIFARAGDGRTSGIQGTGLGLSIVKQIVDMMGGDIKCESELGKGTKFTIMLEVPVWGDETEREPLPSMRVLLIDDDEIFLESSSDVLHDIGVIPDTALGGRAALEMVKEAMDAGDDYTVIISDWRMPDMDGPETIKAIRDIVGEKVPIILVSAYDWTDIEDEARESGASGFISKPLFKSYIHDKLTEALGMKEEKHDDEVSMQEKSMSGKHMLVAEDNELNWEVLSDLLDIFGMTADWAENGKMCAEMLCASPDGKYDAVLMDVQMPVMNGREAAKIIRADEREYVNNIPIIALTADAFAEDISACIEAGMDGHVSKPVDIDILCQELKKAFHARFGKENVFENK